jgi:hypothetical protein
MAEAGDRKASAMPEVPQPEVGCGEKGKGMMHIAHNVVSLLFVIHRVWLHSRVWSL